MKKTNLRLISIILVICCLLSTAYTAAALESSNTSAGDLSANTPVISPEQPITETAINQDGVTIMPIILEEDETKRSEYTKVFVCDDGSLAAATYSSPVHYMDNDGKWCEFTAPANVTENTLITVGKGIKATNNREDSKSNIGIEKDGYSLTWSAAAKFSNGTTAELSKESVSVAQTTTTPVVTDPALLKTKNILKNEITSIIAEAAEKQKAEVLTSSTQAIVTPVFSTALKNNVKNVNLAINNHNSSFIRSINFGSTVIEYDGAFGENTILKYTINGDKIKEDVILTHKGDFTSYTVTIENNGLTGELNDDSSVIFSDDEGIARFKVGAPLMYDAANSTSNDIDVEVVPSRTEFKITYTPDSDWLNSTERVYPVVIDPSYSGIVAPPMSATFVSQSYPNSTLNYETYLRVGDTSNAPRKYGMTESWVVLDSIPAIEGASNYTITSAFIDLRIQETYLNSGFNIDAFIPNAFYTDLVSWNDKPTQLTAIARNVAPSGSVGQISYFIPLGTLPVQWEANDSARRFGVYLKGSYGSVGCNHLYTPEATVTANQPVYLRYYNSIITPTNETLVTNLETGYYKIRSSAYLNRYLSVASDNYTVELSNTSYKWYIINRGNGKYSLNPLPKPNNRVEVHCGEYSDYRPLTSNDYVTGGNTSSNAIQFYLYVDEGGKYSFRPVSASNYAISVYQGDDASMFFYNWYVTAFRTFFKTQYTSCQLNKYGGNNWQKWEISASVSSDIFITDKPEVTYQGETRNVMTIADYQYVSVTLDDYNTFDDVELVASNPQLVQITKTEDKFKLRSIAEGGTTIYLYDHLNNPCDSFELNIYNPNTLETNSTDYAFCEMRGYRLDVDLKSQEWDYTCGAAACITILNYKGITEIDESAFFTESGGIHRTLTNEEHVPLIGAYTSHMNDYLNDCSATTNFLNVVIDHESDEYTQEIERYYNIIRNNLISDFPVAVLMSDSTTELLGYVTYGHYIVIKAIYKDSNGNIMVDINDPFSSEWYSTNTGAELTGISFELLYDKNVYSLETPGWNIICNGTWVL